MFTSMHKGFHKGGTAAEGCLPPLCGGGRRPPPLWGLGRQQKHTYISINMYFMHIFQYSVIYFTRNCFDDQLFEEAYGLLAYICPVEVSCILAIHVCARLLRLHNIPNLRTNQASMGKRMLNGQNTVIQHTANTQCNYFFCIVCGLFAVWLCLFNLLFSTLGWLQPIFVWWRCPAPLPFMSVPDYYDFTTSPTFKQIKHSMEKTHVK